MNNQMKKGNTKKGEVRRINWIDKWLEESGDKIWRINPCKWRAPKKKQMKNKSRKTKIKVNKVMILDE